MNIKLNILRSLLIIYLLSDAIKIYENTNKMRNVISNHGMQCQYPIFHCGNEVIDLISTKLQF